jgi:enamine deaminase RidA (YjgF/YER057c/UK114 family)
MRGEFGTQDQGEIMSIEERLRSNGIELPTPASPIANYVPCVRTGSLLFVSGQICLGPDGRIAPAHAGKLGAGVGLAEGQAAARLCAINVLAQARAALGSLDAIKRCVRLGGFINCVPDFAQLPQVMNGASDLMVLVSGDAGRHARTTIGVAQLPLDAAVEVEAIFEVA